MSRRPWYLPSLGGALCLAGLLCLAPPAQAAGSCVSVAQHGGPVPLADPRPYQPVNGTGGFSVFGANTLPQGGFSVGLGYLGTRPSASSRRGCST